MNGLPVMLNLQGRRCVVVGSGPVGLRRAQSLVSAGALVTLISPQAAPSITPSPSLTILNRPYQSGDLQDAFLVVIATDDPAINQTVAEDAQAYRTLMNRSDAPQEGDIQMMAQAQQGHVMLAVHTSGVSPVAARAIRDEVAKALPSYWPEVLAIAAPWRQKIQQAMTDPAERSLRLHALASPVAITLYRTQGQAALEDFYRHLATPSEACSKASALPQEGT